MVIKGSWFPYRPPLVQRDAGDGMLRQWPTAGFSLLVVAILSGAALMAAR
jgi:hypothetical protein